jgi:hypothetical protein
MSYEDMCIRESVGDGTIDPDDVCIVCDKRNCVCEPEDEPTVPASFEDWLKDNKDTIDIGGNVIPDRVQANHDRYNNERHPFT